MQKDFFKKILLTSGTVLALQSGLLQAADQGVTPPPPSGVVYPGRSQPGPGPLLAAARLCEDLAGGGRHGG